MICSSVNLLLRMSVSRRYGLYPKSRAFNGSRSFDPAAQGKRSGQARAIFGRFSIGLQPKCDDWIYDKEPRVLNKKMKYFTGALNEAIARTHFPMMISSGTANL